MLLHYPEKLWHHTHRWWQTTKFHTEENVDLVNDLALSQEDMPQTHRTVCEILIISQDVMKLPLGICLLLEHSIICKNVSNLNI